MREQWEPIKGGTPTLKLWSESESDQQLNTVERALLEATLTDSMKRHRGLREQVKSARCTCREFNGYGAFLNLIVADATTRISACDSPMGHALINLENSPREALGTLVFLSSGRINCLELYPTDGEAWPAEECRDLLSTSPWQIVMTDERGHRVPVQYTYDQEKYNN